MRKRASPRSRKNFSVWRTEENRNGECRQRGPLGCLFPKKSGIKGLPKRRDTTRQLLTQGGQHGSPNAVVVVTTLAFISHQDGTSCSAPSAQAAPCHSSAIQRSRPRCAWCMSSIHPKGTKTLGRGWEADGSLTCPRQEVPQLLITGITGCTSALQATG